MPRCIWAEVVVVPKCLNTHLYKNVKLESPMLHAKFQDHSISGSGERF